MPTSEFSSCDSKNPLIKLDPEGSSDLFSYNLKPGRFFDAKGYIHLDIPLNKFVDSTTTPPKDNFWETVSALADTEILQRINDDLTDGSSTPLILNNSYAFRLPLANTEHQGKKVATKTVEAKKGAHISDISIAEILNQVNKGKRPILKRNFYGKPVFTFFPRPVVIRPQLTLVFHYKVCSYLGYSGAGKVVKTMSLLPGEKVTLTVKNFNSDTETRMRSENVLDSFSEYSANDLQTTVENETGLETTTANSSNHSSEIGGGLQVGVNLGVANLGLSGGGGVSNQSTVANTSAAHVAAISSALSSHVQQSTYNREINVNTESSSTSINETEDSSVRVIENINMSRVLNFIFKQVNQEYLTLTYLDDVSIVYSNGYPESQKVAKLSDIDTLLKSVIKDDEIENIRKLIFASLCSIYDYQGVKTSFIEKVEEEITDCIGGGGVLFTNSFIRKRADLSHTYHEITVPGIIMDVKTRVLPTSSLITEAMLGAGEALDCYNQKLQSAAVVHADYENDMIKQQMQVIDGITDPLDKAKFYKKVFGSCCDVSQSGGNCNCGQIDPTGGPETTRA